MGNECEHGGTAEEWRTHVIAYWLLSGVTFGPWSLDQAFDMLRYVMEDKHSRWDATQTLGAFKVGFLDTSNGPLGGLLELGKNSDLSSYVNSLDDLVRGDRAVDTLMGFSEGGAVIMRWMRIQLQRDEVVPELSLRTQIKGVLLLQPGANQLGDPELDASDFPGTIIVTRNATHARFGGVYGTVQGAINFNDDSCGGGLNHCNYDANFATSFLDVSLILLGRWHTGE